MPITLEQLKNNYKKFEEAIGYTYKNKEYAINALTHSSYANEMNIESYERLEFLGDSVLNIIISERLFIEYPELSEGEMTRTRAAVVCEASLSQYSRQMDIGNYLLLGKGEEISGGRNRNSILADVFEAILGSIYMDRGMEAAKEFVSNNINEILTLAVSGKYLLDFKTELQERMQEKGDANIEYRIIAERGPEHNKSFVVQALVDGVPLATSKGKTKKEAEQKAAKQILSQLKKD